MFLQKGAPLQKGTPKASKKPRRVAQPAAPFDRSSVPHMQASNEGTSSRILSLSLSLSQLLLLSSCECISHRPILPGSLVVNQSRAFGNLAGTRAGAAAVNVGRRYALSRHP
jgi:hypothetical protein